MLLDYSKWINFNRYMLSRINDNLITGHFSHDSTICQLRAKLLSGCLFIYPALRKTLQDHMHWLFEHQLSKHLHASPCNMNAYYLYPCIQKLGGHSIQIYLYNMQVVLTNSDSWSSCIYIVQDCIVEYNNSISCVEPGIIKRYKNQWKSVCLEISRRHKLK